MKTLLALALILGIITAIIIFFETQYGKQKKKDKKPKDRSEIKWDKHLGFGERKLYD